MLNYKFNNSKYNYKYISFEKKITKCDFKIKNFSISIKVMILDKFKYIKVIIDIVILKKL